jgi:hypothetical protein
MKDGAWESKEIIHVKRTMEIGQNMKVKKSGT